jgi:outer membrane protein assembly factor BamB
MTGKAGMLGALALVALIAGCSQYEPILTGERLALRAGDEADVAEPGRAPIALPGPVANTAWAQSAVSPQTRVVHAALGADLAPLWRVGIGQGDSRRKRIVVDPVMADGRIFAMDADHQISAVSEAGAVLWQAALVPPRDTAEQGQGGGLAVSGDTLFAASGFGTLTAFDAATGTVRWRQDFESTATGAPTVSGGLVYLTVGDRAGVAVEAGNGRLRWQVDGVGDIDNVAGSPAPAVAGDRVVFAYGDGSVETAFRQGGLQLWSAELAGIRVGVARAGIDDITGDPVIVGDTVYAGSHSGRMVALNLFDGDRIWSADEGALGPVWPAGGSLFFVSDRNELIRMRADTGTVIWRSALPGYEPVRNPNRRRDAFFVHHGPVLAGGRLIVAGSDGVLRSFAPEDGALLSEVEIPDGATTRPIVAGGTLYVVTRDGDLVAYR